MKLDELIESFESSIPSKYKWNCFEKFKVFLSLNDDFVRIYNKTSNFVSILNYLTECGKFEADFYSEKLYGHMYTKIEPLSFNQYEVEYGRELNSDLEINGYRTFLADEEFELSEEEFENQFGVINVDYFSENYEPLDFNDRIENRRFH
jgi:hypothetical protein